MISEQCKTLFIRAYILKKGERSFSIIPEAGFAAWPAQSILSFSKALLSLPGEGLFLWGLLAKGQLVGVALTLAMGHAQATAHGLHVGLGHAQAE